MAAWFLVLPIHIENLCRLSRGLYIYISSYWHIFAIPPVFIEIYRVGDNRRTVNSSTSLHISDQLGTENVWETLLCWLIVVLWVRKKNVSMWTSFWIFPPVLVTAHVSDCAIELTEAGSGLVGAAQRHHSWNAYLTSMFGHYIGGYIIN